MPERPIPVLAVVGVSFRRVILHFFQLLRVMALYWLIQTVLVLAQTFGASLLIGSPILPVFMLATMVLIVVAMALGVRAWLRTTLLGGSTVLAGQAGSRSFLLKFLLRFAALQIAVVLVPLIFVAGAFAPDPSQRTSDLTGLVVWLVATGSAFVVVAYFWFRLALVLPALVTGDSLTFRGAWKLSAGNGLRMVAGLALIAVVCLLAFLPTTIAVGALSPPFDGPGANPFLAAMIPYFVGSIFIQVGAAIAISALAYYYRILRDQPDPLAVVK